ncbi:hypothetical protein T01_15029 [Trichinella spiralis]|uniref:Uncharacterized protein n=1 Tax=Trichinella spiralis TaxID=6334 RepID=A0A0V1BS69_TRISP|nr:hypothetical protein T01_15029 [Trichinella spiralis]
MRIYFAGAARVISGGKRVSLANNCDHQKVLLGWILVAPFSLALFVRRIKSPCFITSYIGRRRKLNPSANCDDDIPAFHCQRLYEIRYFGVEFVIDSKVPIWSNVL